jgi:hypothetical protein
MNRMALFMVLVVLVGCTYHPPRSLPPQASIGTDASFGLRITQVASLDIDYLIEQPAYVVAIRVTDDRRISVLAPEDGSPLSKSGHHYVRASRGYWVERSYTVTRDGCPLRTQPADPPCSDVTQTITSTSFVPNRDQPRGGYWLLIVSDLRMSRPDILRQTEGLNRSDTSVVSLLRQIPQALIASRTMHWAAYYAAFGTEQDP